MNAPPEVRLYSSWRGRIVAVVAPALLLAVVVGALVRSGPRPLSVVLGLVGAVFGFVSVFDFPVWARIDAEGVTRRTFTRNHTLPWSSVDRLERASGPLRRRGKTGPLIAVIGRRRYLLVDQAECIDEFVMIRRIVAGAVSFEAIEPAADTPPTWLYHRNARPSE